TVWAAGCDGTAALLPRRFARCFVAARETRSVSVLRAKDAWPNACEANTVVAGFARFARFATGARRTRGNSPLALLEAGDAATGGRSALAVEREPATLSPIATPP